MALKCGNINKHVTIGSETIASHYCNTNCVVSTKQLLLMPQINFLGGGFNISNRVNLANSDNQA